MGKWEDIMELDTEDPEDMIEFLAKDLTWTEIGGDQVSIIPYRRLEDFINGKQSDEDAPTEFVVNTKRSKEVDGIACTRINTYLKYVM
jgi:hypothetical protein